MPKIKQDEDGWHPLPVPWRGAGDGIRSLDSLGSDRGEGKQHRHDSLRIRPLPMLNLTQSLKQTYKASLYQSEVAI